MAVRTGNFDEGVKVAEVLVFKWWAVQGLNL